MNPRRLLERAPRIGRVRVVGERAVVLIVDDSERWEVVLPARLRGRSIVNFDQLVALERDRPITREETLLGFSPMEQNKQGETLIATIREYHAPVEDPVAFWERYAESAEAGDAAASDRMRKR